MKRLVQLVAFMFAVAGGAAAQEFVIPPSMQHLASKASETVEVDLDQRMLALASKFMTMDESDPHEVAQMQKVIAGLKSVHVRNYEFNKEGEYNAGDLEGIRAQLMADPQWSRIVGVKSAKDKENVDIFVKAVGDHFGGMWILSTEPKELTIVRLEGNIDLNQLSDLGGNFGIPKVKKQGVKVEAAR